MTGHAAKVFVQAALNKPSGLRIDRNYTHANKHCASAARRPSRSAAPLVKISCRRRQPRGSSDDVGGPRLRGSSASRVSGSSLGVRRSSTGSRPRRDVHGCSDARRRGSRLSGPIPGSAQCTYLAKGTFQVLSGNRRRCRLNKCVARGNRDSTPGPPCPM